MHLPLKLILYCTYKLILMIAIALPTMGSSSSSSLSEESGMFSKIYNSAVQKYSVDTHTYTYSACGRLFI